MKPTNYALACILFAFFCAPLFVKAQSTSWKGTTSTAWSIATNWTNGVPSSTVAAVIGDASFTGNNQPTVNTTAACKSLTVGGSVSTILTLTKNLTVAGNIIINSNGTVNHPASTLTVSGNWTNNGTYANSSTSATVIFGGTAQSLGGSSITTFRKITINAGSVLTLNANFNCSGSSSLLSISGTLNPNEAPTYLVTVDNVIVNNGGVLKINAAVSTSNYDIGSSVTLSSGSIVEYSSTILNQVITNGITYSTLRVSGAGTTKTLAGSLPALRSTSSSVGNIYVLSGTLNLAGFTANRGTSVAGGTLSVSNGAILKIGGTGGFPANYTTNTLSLTSTVEYFGGDQTVSAKTYGNLTLSSSSGAAIKTMPATAFTIAGSLSSNIGTGTSVSYTAASNISVTGSINIGASTTFNGSSFSHGITGNWNNSGTFVPATSTITLKGASTLISGNASQDFYNLTITGSNITAPSVNDINVSGNFATSGSGTFTQTSPATLTMSGTTKTIAGTGIALNNLAISGVVTTASSVALSGNLSVSGSLIASAGTVTMSGTAKSITNSGTLSLKTLLITGSVSTASSFGISTALNCTGAMTASAGTITFSSTSLLSGTVNLYNVTINGTSLSLAANAVLGIAGSFVITAGTFNVTSYVPNTVNYNGGAQTIKGTAYNNLVLSNSGTKTAGAAITVNSAITINPSVSFDASTFTHTIAGNWFNNGNFIAGTSTVQFTGTTNTSISGASTFNTITINKSLSTYSISLLNNISVGTINMTSGILTTNSNALTITTTRTGNGIILGTITRTHAFAASIAYAFEGPGNLITFAAGVSGVSSVTVNVTVATVADFPYNGAIGRSYDISIPSGTYVATLRLHYEDAELNGNDESVMQIWRHNAGSWNASGKTSNSTVSNYVEKTLLTNITGRWTMTDDGSVLSWNGSASSDWNNSANWTLVQGTFSGAPSSTDIAQIGTTAFTNQPVITTAATVKSILFGSTQASTITLNSGGSLTINGGVNGAWSANAVHTINANAQTITINGDLALSDNTSNHAINLNITTGTVSVSGSVTQSGGANINFSGAGTLNIGKDFIYQTGTFTPGTGLVKYNGSVSQVIASVPYNNLTIIKTTGTIGSLSLPATIGGNLVITSGEFDITNTLTVTGSVTISAGASFDANASTVNVSGNWTKAATGTFNGGTGTVNFVGSNAQTISAGGFNNLNIGKTSGTATLSGNNTINGALTLAGGTLNLATYTLNQSAAGNIFSIANGATLLVGGTDNFPANFNTYTLGANCLVHYNGSIAQAVASVNYGNLTFSNGGAAEKTLAGASNIQGDILINNGASVNGGNSTISLDGNWTNNGGIFTAGSGDVLFNGIAKTITGNTTFNDVTINGSYTVAGSDLVFNGHFQVTPTGAYVAGSGVATVNGDFTNSGSASSSGTTTFTGTSLQTIRLINALVSTSTGIVNFNGTISPVFNSTSTPQFATLNINNTAGVNPSVSWSVFVAMNVNAGGIFNGGTSSHFVYGSFSNAGTFTSDGIMNFIPPSAQTVAMGASGFSSDGTIKFGGAGLLTISGTPAKLTHVIIANTNSAGITPPGNWTIDSNFVITSDAKFIGGSNTYTVGGNIESDGILSGGNSTFNLVSTSGTVIASAATTFNNLTITGSITPQTDFHVAGNFTNNGTYDGTIGVLIMSGGNAVSIAGTTTPFPIAQLTIEKTGNAVVTQSVNLSSLIFLNIYSGVLATSTRTITQDPGGGVLIINDAATLRLGGTNSLPGFSGYGLDVNSNVEYAGTTQNIGNAVDYGNLVISSAGNKNAFVPFVVRGDLTVTAGTVNSSTFSVTHSVAGNFIMTGGALAGTSSTYSLNGAANQTITLLSNLINLAINKSSGQVNLGSNVNVNVLLNMLSGKISLGSYDLTIGTSGSISNYNSSKYIIASGAGSLYQQVASGGTKTYPVGSSTNYLPATVAFTAGSTTDNIGVKLFAAVYDAGTSGNPLTNGVVNNSWLITESVPGGSDATITLQWPASLENSGFGRNACRINHHNGTWDLGFADLSATGTDPYTVSRSGFTSFSIFTVGTVAALPVTWLDVSGKQLNGANHIYWSTASEMNNAFFVVESSTNNRDFSEIGRMSGNMNSNSEHHYHFVHSDFTASVNYYRIRQVDIDGKSSYSKVIRINSTIEALRISRIYPVPARDHVTLDMVTTEPVSISIIVESITGTRMLTRDARLTKGNNQLSLNLTGLASGLYQLRILDANGNTDIKKIAVK